MARTLHIRKPSAREIERLDAVLERECDPQVLRRAQVLLQYADGWHGTDIAAALGVHPNTVYADLHAFDAQALACLGPLSPGGASSHFTSAQVAEMARIALVAPQEFGLVDARWTLSTLRAFLMEPCHLVATISREHLRRLLKKTTFVFAPYGANSSAMIPCGERF